MKIIHCSDVHLNSKLETNLSPEQARARSGELCGTFTRLTEYAAENGVAAVIIAGDLFDTGRTNAKTASLVLDAIAAARDTDFLYLRGNHDESERALAGRALPDNFKLFSDSWTYFDYGCVTVAGIELSRFNCTSLYDELKLDPKRTNIAVLHGMESTQAGSELVCLPSLRGRGIDYLALGHLHAYKSAVLDGRGEYCYCGCLEGRGFDECGEKGFVLLEADERGVRHEFVPFAGRTIFDLPVDVTGAETVTEIERRMSEAARDVPASSLVKFTLTGSRSPDAHRDESYLLARFQNRFYFTKIKDLSRLALDPSAFENDISLKGEFIRTVLASELCDEDKERVIGCGLRALSGEAIEL